MADVIRIWGAVFAGLVGLAFGSFLNVCLSRWPEAESIVKPRSHCRNCGHVLAWWENVPLVSWMALRGRCRECGAWIGWRYVVVETAMGGLWAISVWQTFRGIPDLRAFATPGLEVQNIANFLFSVGAKLVLCWLLLALAVLDLEHLWLPDWLTLSGTAVGFLGTLVHIGLFWILASPTPVLLRSGSLSDQRHRLYIFTLHYVLGIAAAAGLILAIRWTYWLVRRREGIGLGDAKLMALLAAWLGWQGALLSFGVGVVLGAAVALVVLAWPKDRDGDERGLVKLPLGTFLCIGGIVSALWGHPIIRAYLRWAGL